MKEDTSVASSSVGPFSVFSGQSVATRRVPAAPPSVVSSGGGSVTKNAPPPPPPPDDDFYIPPPPDSTASSLLKKLPPGWTTVTDDNGQIYYWDVITGQTRWTAPDSDQVPPPPAIDEFELARQLPSGWMSAVDADGSIYYWNIATGETSWTHPSCQNAPPPPPTMGMRGEKLPPGWTSVVHDDGNLYYWEVHTGKTRWTHPSLDVPSPPRDFDAVWKESLENPLMGGYPSTRPKSNLVLALVSLILFPPIGLFAVLHACQVRYCWSKGKYVDAHFHAQVSRGFGILASLAGVALWVYVLIFSEGGVHNFSDWRPKKLSSITWPWK
jgi:hypothetical protein